MISYSRTNWNFDFKYTISKTDWKDFFQEQSGRFKLKNDLRFNFKNRPEFFNFKNKMEVLHVFQEQTRISLKNGF